MMLHTLPPISAEQNGMPTCAVELLSAVGLFCAALLFSSAFTLDASLYVVANVVLPVTVLIICPWTAYRLIQKDKFLVWSPVTWLLLACACYYGLGPLVYVFGTFESLTFMDAYYAVNELQLMRTNFLNVISISLVLAFSLAGIFAFRPRRIIPFGSKETTLRNMAIVMLAVGLPVKYLYVLPSVLQLVSWDAQGWARSLAIFATLAAAPLFALNKIKGGRLVPALIALFVLEICSSLVTFSKLEVMRTLLIFLIAWFSVTGNISVLFRGVLAVAVIYVVFLSSFVTFMRAEYGLSGSGSLSQISAGYRAFTIAGRDEVADSLPGVQGWWTRLSYPNAQAFAMDSFDRGAAGNSVGLAVDAVIPRAFYPDKPDITVGDYFNQLVTGSAMSKSAPGVFAEAYWCGGWPLTLLIASYVGLFFGFFTQYNYRMVASSKYLYLGVGWLGLAAALQPDSWFAATFVGPVPTAIIFHGILFVFIEPAISRLTKNNALQLRIQ